MNAKLLKWINTVADTAAQMVNDHHLSPAEVAQASATALVMPLLDAELQAQDVDEIANAFNDRFAKTYRAMRAKPQ